MWTPETLRKQWRKEKCLPLLEIKLQLPLSLDLMESLYWQSYRKRSYCCRYEIGTTHHEKQEEVCCEPRGRSDWEAIFVVGDVLNLGGAAGLKVCESGSTVQSRCSWNPMFGISIFCDGPYQFFILLYIILLFFYFFILNYFDILKLFLTFLEWFRRIEMRPQPGSQVLSFSWFQTFALFWMLYAFFWVIPWLLKFMFRLFGNVGI
jgi:hypothetical protein